MAKPNRLARSLSSKNIYYADVRSNQITIGKYNSQRNGFEKLTCVESSRSSLAGMIFHKNKLYIAGGVSPESVSIDIARKTNTSRIRFN